MAENNKQLLYSRSESKDEKPRTSRARSGAFGRPFEYAIQLPSWIKDSNSNEEQNAAQLFAALVDIFGIDYVRAVPGGKIDNRNGYIKVAANQALIERWAEEDKIRLKVKPWLGGGYREYTRQARLDGYFTHPDCKCESERECKVCCPVTDEYNTRADLCTCNYFLPYHTQEMVHVRIVEAFDNWYRNMARIEAKKRGENILVTNDDVKQFLDKFAVVNQLSRGQATTMFRSFDTCNGDKFQQYLDVEIQQMVGHDLGNELATKLYNEIQRETSDDVNIPPGKGLLLALNEKKVKQVYPLHSPYPGNSGKTMRKILQEYCSWGNSIFTVMMFTRQSKEFLTFLREYMGEKISLYFAFLHFYTSWLLPMILFGLLLALSQYARAADNVGVPLYCLFVALWSTIMLEFWQRHSAFLAHQWDMSSYEEQERELLEFVEGTSNTQHELGFYEPYGAWVDMSEYYKTAVKKYRGIRPFIRFQHRDTQSPLPSWLCFCVPGGESAQRELNTQFWRLLKQMFSWSIVLTSVAATIAVTLGILVLRLIIQNDVDVLFGGVVGGLLNALSIAVLDYFFQDLAVVLNQFENHRTATQYEDSLIAKQFVFTFINSYFSLFYIAFFKGIKWNGNTASLFGYEESCKDIRGDPTNSCMTELAYQLTTVMLSRTIIGNIVEWALPKLRFLGNFWNILRLQRKQIQQNRPELTPQQLELELEELEKKKGQIDSAEKQAFLPKYTSSSNVSGTFYDYSELAIQFGYVVLFAPAFPLAPIIAVINNVIENHTDGFKILQSTQKSDYQGAQDMGTWSTIFRIISYISVITNCCILGFTSSQIDEFVPDNRNTLAIKIFIVLMAEHIVFAILFLIQYAIPMSPYRVRVAEARTLEISRAEQSYRDYTEWLTKVREQEQKFEKENKSDAEIIAYMREQSTQMMYYNMDQDDMNIPPEIVEDAPANVAVMNSSSSANIVPPAH